MAMATQQGEGVISVMPEIDLEPAWGDGDVPRSPSGEARKRRSKSQIKSRALEVGYPQGKG